MQFQPLSHSLIPSPLLTSSSSNSTTTNDTFHQHVQAQPSAASIHLSSLATAQQPTLNRSTQHISPRLDALAYVSTVELPKISLAPLLPPEPEEEDESGRVRAYAKLEFPQHDFFIRKLTVTIGRRPPARPDACNEEEEDPIDVDLGPIRAVSRRHARIYFDWARGRWTLSVAGRNGCVVDGRWRARGEVLALGARTKIQIAERIFYFILPQVEPPPAPQPTIEPHQLESEIVPSESEFENEPESAFEPPPPLPNHKPQFELPTRPPPRPALELPSREPPRSTLELPSRPPPRPALELPSRPPIRPTLEHPTRPLPCPSPERPSPPLLPPDPDPERDPEEEQEQEEEEESELSETDDDEDSSHISIRAPVPPPPLEDSDESPSEGSDDEPRPPSPPRGVPIYPGARPNEYESDESDDSEVMLSSETFGYEPGLPSKMPKKTSAKVPKKAWAAFADGGGGKGKGKMGGGGKGGGKMSRSTANDLSGSIDVDPSRPRSPPKKESTSGKGKGKSKGKVKDDIKGNDGSTTTTPPVVVKERRKIVCVAPAGADIGTETRKPPYTYASMIAQALTAQADEDGKMLVNEMCEWIAGVYPFYGIKPKGTDWQSAVRHNLNADKRFKRIERQPTDGGKGNFWTLKPEERVNFDGLELRRPKPEPPPKPPPKAASKPSASIANLARDGIQTTPRRRTRDDVLVNDSITTTPDRPRPGPSQAGPITAPATRPPPPTPISTESGIRPPPPTPNPPITPLPALGTFSAARTSDRLNPALLAIDSSRPDLHDPALHDPHLRDPSPKPPPPPPPAPSTSTRPSTTKPFQIVIEPLPPSSAPPVPTGTGPTDELSQMMLRDPPMVSQAHRLVLNPSVFGKLTPAQVASLEKLGSVQAIKILQTYIVEHYKELMKKARRKGKRKNEEEEGQSGEAKKGRAE